MTENNHPFAIEVKAGETKHLCACGLSQNMPFCDGTHRGTGKKPVSHTFEKDQTAYICGCGKSKSSPFCDGSHSKE